MPSHCRHPRLLRLKPLPLRQLLPCGGAAFALARLRLSPFASVSSCRLSFALLLRPPFFAPVSLVSALQLGPSPLPSLRGSLCLRWPRCRLLFALLSCHHLPASGASLFSFESASFLAFSAASFLIARDLSPRSSLISPSSRFLPHNGFVPLIYSLRK